MGKPYSLLVIVCITDTQANTKHLEYYPNPVHVKKGGELHVTSLNVSDATIDLSTDFAGDIEETEYKYDIPTYSTDGEILRIKIKKDATPKGGSTDIDSSDCPPVKRVGPNMIIEP